MPKLDPIWQWKKADWPEFTEILQKTNIRLPHKLNERRIEYLLDKVYKNIYSAMEKTVPKMTPSGKQKPDKWYGEKLRVKRNKLAKLKRLYQRKPSDRNYQNYICEIADYKKLCRYTKEDEFKDFLETLPDIQSLSSFHEKHFKSETSTN